MRLELAERLQCPGDHRATPLVVVASAVVDRDLRRGTAGCMQCGREARFLDGDLWGAATSGVPASPRGAEGAEGRRDAARHAEAPSIDALDRLQALLGLAEAGGAVLLGGRYAAYAAGLQARLDLMVVVMDPEDRTFTSAARVIGFAGAIPFTDGTFRAAALDDGRLIAAAGQAVRPGGRIVAPITCARPAMIALLAADAAEWVGERGATPVVVPLQRSVPQRPNG
ncbi:MAG: hypothetical protein ACO3SD_07130 [Gemmatimonadaceae bacterium]|jgi:hypothetical protein